MAVVAPAMLMMIMTVVIKPNYTAFGRVLPYRGAGEVNT